MRYHIRHILIAAAVLAVLLGLAKALPPTVAWIGGWLLLLVSVHVLATAIGTRSVHGSTRQGSLRSVQTLHETSSLRSVHGSTSQSSLRSVHGSTSKSSLGSVQTLHETSSSRKRPEGPPVPQPNPLPNPLPSDRPPPQSAKLPSPRTSGCQGSCPRALLIAAAAFVGGAIWGLVLATSHGWIGRYHLGQIVSASSMAVLFGIGGFALGNLYTVSRRIVLAWYRGQ